MCRVCAADDIDFMDPNLLFFADALEHALAPDRFTRTAIPGYFASNILPRVSAAGIAIAV